MILIELIIFGLFGLACFWSGAKIAQKEKIYEKVIDGEAKYPPEFVDEQSPIEEEDAEG